MLLRWQADRDLRVLLVSYHQNMQSKAPHLVDIDTLTSASMECEGLSGGGEPGIKHMPALLCPEA